MPQKPGNHGRIIPQDAELIRRLYWDENNSTLDLAAMFDVTHKSIMRVMRKLGVPTRRIGRNPVRHCEVDGCTEPVKKIKHSNNGSLYGTKCEAHRSEARKSVADQYWSRVLGWKIWGVDPASVSEEEKMARLHLLYAKREFAMAKKRVKDINKSIIYKREE